MFISDFQVGNVPVAQYTIGQQIDGLIIKQPDDFFERGLVDNLDLKTSRYKVINLTLLISSSSIKCPPGSDLSWSVSFKETDVGHWRLHAYRRFPLPLKSRNTHDEVFAFLHASPGCANI